MARIEGEKRRPPKPRLEKLSAQTTGERKGLTAGRRFMFRKGAFERGEGKSGTGREFRGKNFATGGGKIPRICRKKGKTDFASMGRDERESRFSPRKGKSTQNLEKEGEFLS